MTGTQDRARHGRHGTAVAFRPNLMIVILKVVNLDRILVAMAALQDKIWYFDVSDPTNHPKGFTIYKITSKVAQRSAIISIYG